MALGYLHANSANCWIKWSVIFGYINGRTFILQNNFLSK
jgi:hypothetical protein